MGNSQTVNIHNDSDCHCTLEVQCRGNTQILHGQDMAIAPRSSTRIKLLPNSHSDSWTKLSIIIIVNGISRTPRIDISPDIYIGVKHGKIVVDRSPIEEE